MKGSKPLWPLAVDVAFISHETFIRPSWLFGFAADPHQTVIGSQVPRTDLHHILHGWVLTSHRMFARHSLNCEFRNIKGR